MNKLMARIVAVVLAVMMLGTVSFAAPTATKNAITTDIASQDMYTVKAINADGDIIAMYQSTTAPTSIAIDSTKVALGEEITVEYGGVTGAYFSYPVVISGEEIADGKIDVATTYTDKNGLVYENVAVAKNTFTPAGIAKKIGYKLKAFGGEANYTGAKTVDIGKEVSLSGGGSFSYEVILLAVPAGVTVEATPYVLY